MIDLNYLYRQYLKQFTEWELEGETWKDEFGNDIPSPSNEVLYHLKLTLNNILKKDYFPDKIYRSVDEGVTIAFIAKDNGMYLDIYNDKTCSYYIYDVETKQSIKEGEIDWKNIEDTISYFYTISGFKGGKF